MRVFYEAGNIYKLYGSWHNFCRFRKYAQFFQTLVWHRYYAHVWFNGCKRYVTSSSSLLSKRVKEGGFPHVWQADDSDFERHVGTMKNILYLVKGLGY